MSAPREIPPQVEALQTKASDPGHSAWVSANAGSGKTHVLAQRVIRLLLDGVDPARILCITFTKAAAANMANKVFEELRGWTALGDAALDKAMRKIGVKSADTRLRARARQLFALALETPGGLKVQTIHAFCTQLLHLFPFEANVSARFEVLDDISEKQLLARLTLDVLLQAAAAPQTPLGRALAQAVIAAADSTFQDMVREVIARRDDLEAWIAQDGSVEAALAQLARGLGVRPDETAAEIDAAIFGDSPLAPSEWAGIGAILNTGKATDKKQGKLFQTLASLSGAAQIETYLDIFCTAKRDKTKDRIVTQAIQDEHGDLSAHLNAERDRVWDLVLRKRAIAARDRSAGLFTVAHAVIVRFRDEKNRRGLLDYDDLIDKTLALLSDDRAAWVHYKLDRGIHHVLIDEAQDTSPKQWDIVRSLVAEFFAGQGAHDRKRTLFAVGDEKQSIFSFQGAAPREFAANRAYFAAAHQHAELGFEAAEFKYSFRSGTILLGAVDTVFARAEAFAGLTADAVAPVHEALPDNAPGLVEIWDLEKSDPLDNKPGWAAPFDIAAPTGANVKLARRIAVTVAAWMKQGRRPKDVLILVRRRGALFEAIIRALKNAKIEVAGADRLVLIEHIAAMDLMVLADAVLLPDDDLALATVLKSPLFGLTDEALERIAIGRDGRLYAALRERRPELAAQFEAIAVVAQTKSPFAFYAWLLGAQDGRRKMLSRLGHEANDALDEFLNLALDYERAETPSLQGFIAWLRAAAPEIKRDMEIGRDEVRVMTVHGAKGLEAPIVILADTTTPPQGWHPPRLLQMPPERSVPGAAGPLVWAGGKPADVAAMAVARAVALDSARDEYRRLLYVAMTRAAERLVVCGTQGEKAVPDGCWYRLIDDALRSESVREQADDGVGEVWRYRKGGAAEPEAERPAISTAPESKPERPRWLTEPAVVEPLAIGRIRPSSAADDDDDRPSGGGTATALLRGSLTHRLLQSLPDIAPVSRTKAAADFLARNGGDLSAADRAEIAGKIASVLGDARFAPLFAPGSRAEVPIVGRVDVGGKIVAVSGQIDRVAIGDGEVLIGDFKTNRPAPRRIEEVPRAYIRQLALYRALLTKLYPGKTVRAVLIWTEVPDLMELSDGLLDRTLAQVTSA